MHLPPVCMCLFLPAEAGKVYNGLVGKKIRHGRWFVLSPLISTHPYPRLRDQ